MDERLKFRNSILAITLACVSQGMNAQTMASPGFPVPGSPIMFWRLTLWNNFGPDTPTQVVIRDEEEFKRIWGRMYPVHSYEDYLRAPKPPNIDFAKEVVIPAALGSKSSGGYGYVSIAL
ncbi:MAG: hypothetical protein ABWY05_11415 [Noviherbaspirillum sp.]